MTARSATASRGINTPSINGATGPTLKVTPTGVLIANRTNIANVPLAVQAMAGQTGNLQEWRDNTGTPLTFIGPTGYISATTVFAGGFAGPYMTNTANTGPYLLINGSTVQVENRNTASNVAFTVKGMAGQTGNLIECRNSASGLLASFASDGYISTTSGIATTTVAEASGTGPYLSFGASALRVLNRSNTANTALVARGMAAQTGNLFECQDSSASVLAKVNAGGVGTFAGGLLSPNYQSGGNTGPYVGMDNTTVTVFNRTTASLVPLTIKGMAAQSGNLLETQDNAGTTQSGFSANGRLMYTAAITATTVGAAGGAAALPATPTGYLLIVIAGTQYKLPYYAN